MFLFDHRTFRMDVDIDASLIKTPEDLFTSSIGSKCLHELFHFFQLIFTSDGVALTLLYRALLTCLELMIKDVCRYEKYEEGPIPWFLMRNKDNIFTASLCECFLDYNEAIAYTYGDYASLLTFKTFQRTGESFNIEGYTIDEGSALILGKPVRVILVRDQEGKTEIFGAYDIFESISTIVERSEQLEGHMFYRLYEAIIDNAAMDKEVLAIRIFSKISGSKSPELFLICAEAALQANYLSRKKSMLEDATNAGVRLVTLAKEFSSQSENTSIDSADKTESIYRKSLKLLGFAENGFSSITEQVSLIENELLLTHPLKEYLDQLMMIRSNVGKPQPLLISFHLKDTRYVDEIIHQMASRHLLPLIKMNNGILATKHSMELISFDTYYVFVASLIKDGLATCKVQRDFPFACDGECLPNLLRMNCVLGKMIQERFDVPFVSHMEPEKAGRQILIEPASQRIIKKRGSGQLKQPIQIRAEDFERLNSICRFSYYVVGIDNVAILTSS